MEDTLIEYNTAVLAKEKGFDIDTDYVYKTAIVRVFEEGKKEATWIERDPDIYRAEFHGISNGGSGVIEFREECSAPSQHLLGKWLREEHGIHVNPIPFRDFPDNEITGYYVGEIYNNKGKELYSGDDTYPTYEQAYEKGLQEGLKLIKS